MRAEYFFDATGKDPSTNDKAKVAFLHRMNVGDAAIRDVAIPLAEELSPFVSGLRVTSNAQAAPAPAKEPAKELSAEEKEVMEATAIAKENQAAAAASGTPVSATPGFDKAPVGEIPAAG